MLPSKQAMSCAKGLAMAEDVKEDVIEIPRKRLKLDTEEGDRDGEQEYISNNNSTTDKLASNEDMPSTSSGILYLLLNYYFPWSRFWKMKVEKCKQLCLFYFRQWIPPREQTSWGSNDYSIYNVKLCAFCLIFG
jgi:hypothetical protein